MIRINLLPNKKIERKNNNLYHLIAMAAAVLLSVAGSLGAWLYYEGEVSAREATKTANQQRIKELEDILGELNKLDEEKALLNAQLAAIQKLERSRRGPVRMLDDLSTYIPKRVWIQTITEATNALKLTGSAIDNTDVSEFMRNLQKSPYFKDVQLKFTQSQDEKNEKTKIYKFEISCKLDYGS